MDDELYRAFVTESEESITELTNSLLELESNPEDEEAIDDIFRRAHTLKGNFGAMGFDDAATVAHAIEDLLEGIRRGRIDATPDRMDLAFEGVDLLLDILRAVEEDGESTVATAATVEAIRAAANGAEEVGGGPTATAGTSVGSRDTEANSDDPTSERDRSPKAEDVDAALAAVDDEALAGVDRLLRVSVRLDGGGMKGVDAGLFLSGIPDTVAVVGTSPSMESIEDGDYGEEIELYVAGLGATETAETFADLWSVSEATVTDVSAAIARSEGDDDGMDHPAADDGAAAPAGPPPEATSDAAGSGTAESDDGAGGGESDGAHSISAVKSVRVDVEQLDELHELVEQLVTSRIKLRGMTDDTGAGLDVVDELEKISSSLQNTVMDMRLVPLEKVFEKFPRLVRDLARAEDKRVNFAVTGQDIELDRTILDEISDPLMHVLRNAVDHGIEPPAVREGKGKDPEGTVELSAEREHDTVVITIADDGRGLDVDRLRETAVERGIATADEVAAMDDDAVYAFVFHPGFSTNDEVTDVSGRGVGMDVVETTVESLDGSVSVDSDPDQGTTFRLRLPVSVAIVKVLFVEVGSRTFGVPIKSVDEISRTRRIDTVNGAEVVVHEDSVFPLVRLGDALNVPDPAADDGMVVRIRPSDRRIALRCDRVIRQEEVVVTPLEGPLAGTRGLSGTSVIGDGNVVPILDVGTLALPEAGRRAARDGVTVSGEGAD